MKAAARALVAAWLKDRDPAAIFGTLDDDGVLDCLWDAGLHPLLDAIAHHRDAEEFRARMDAGFPDHLDNLADLAA